MTWPPCNHNTTALIVGWIMRGFAGIPMRSDTRYGAKP